MPCPQCDHCKQLAERAKLVLSTRLRAGAQGTDLPFYREFGAVYDLAVDRYRQPMRAIREANPDLSAHQCRSYLKRARALGLVRTPPATGAPRPVVRAVAERQAAVDGTPAWLHNLRATGTAVPAETLVVAGVFPTVQEAKDELERLTSAGLGEWTRHGWLAADPA